MDLENHILSQKSVLEKMDTATQQFLRLNRIVLDTLKPPSGPYLLIHHNSSLMHRINELKIITKRLYENRILLHEHDLKELSLLPKMKPGVFCPEFNELRKKSSEINNEIQLDFQSLFIFIIIALDEWARLASFVLGFDDSEDLEFKRIALDEKHGRYIEIWTMHKADILWLDIFTRAYRNKMVAHRKQPWQLSTTRQIGEMDWNFFTPIAHGWINEKDLFEKKQKLHDLSLKYGVVIKESEHSLVFELLSKYAELDITDRDLVYNLAIEIGFKTPSFQSIAHRFADFISAATETLIKIAETNPGRINLGARA